MFSLKKNLNSILKNLFFLNVVSTFIKVIFLRHRAPKYRSLLWIFEETRLKSKNSSIHCNVHSFQHLLNEPVSHCDNIFAWYSGHYCINCTAHWQLCLRNFVYLKQKGFESSNEKSMYHLGLTNYIIS